ncbi:TetR/AcrR family transcriptional regulator [Streptomyces sp. LP05-1]|uniref:TetR/AcrR family transcriptional regulator n=1 Tax=Streptomyces pyxinae TaxID=2970734 RepID=A0ABT2CF59_9ACTN|nr:ScbR family autoregulator-binding transcription factor [Streptomyces sp. LP05-1]MCS0636048.1 TetR/AcrR family transcriptional regulator [Streptomyces sp. LP05-1]
MARQERAHRTRWAILEAAARLFDELGYEATTIGMVIERTEITRGGLYFHFTSKEELARAVLDEAVTSTGLVPHPFKVQEWVDLGLLLAHRMPMEPILSAAVRLSVDPRARRLFGTRWPDWVEVGSGLLAEAKERGELLPHVDPEEVARLCVGAWTGVQIVTDVLRPARLPQEVSDLYAMLLPAVVSPGVLAKLDLTVHRAPRLLAEAREAAGTGASGPVPAGDTGAPGARGDGDGAADDAC